MIPRGRECSRLSRSCVLILLCWLALHTLTSSLSQRLQFSYLNEDLEFVDLTDSGSEAITAAPIAGQQQQQKDPTFLVILIITRPKSIFRRKAIRESFLRHANETGHGKSVKHYFVIGSEGLERDLQLRLQEEPDLLMLPIQDGYERLTVKVLSAMSVLHVIEDFKYVLKVDDDMFVRVPELVKDLEDNHPRKMHYQGYFRGAVKVLRDQPENKWFEPDYPICDSYVPYALGAAYVLSSDLVDFLASNSNYFKLFRNEDVSIGTWLSPLNVKRFHDIRFDSEVYWGGCWNGRLVLPARSEPEFDLLYQRLSTGKSLCFKEVKFDGPYLYDWSQIPSNCCSVKVLDLIP